ncbi:hypothetical protein PGB90_005061 [Kerria lacca]
MLRCTFRQQYKLPTNVKIAVQDLIVQAQSLVNGNNDGDGDYIKFYQSATSNAACLAYALRDEFVKETNSVSDQTVFQVIFNM